MFFPVGLLCSWKRGTCPSFFFSVQAERLTEHRTELECTLVSVGSKREYIQLKLMIGLEIAGYVTSTHSMISSEPAPPSISSTLLLNHMTNPSFVLFA